MSTPTKIAPSPPPVEEMYRPVSQLAVIGLVLALISGLGFLLDAPTLLLVFAFLGLVVSLYARVQILQSDGTLAGKAVASAGIALSLISGLGWSTSYLTTYFIVRQETTQFLDIFFEKLKEGKEGEAFLLTRSRHQRTLPDPNNIERLRAHFSSQMGGSEFDGFRGDQVPAMAIRYGKKVDWKHLRLAEWNYSQGTYNVKHVYLMTTPALEGEVEFHLKAEVSTDSKAVRRPWKYERGKFTGTGSHFPYGAELEKAYADAKKTLEQWIQAVVDRSQQRRGDAVLLTMKPEQREELAALIVPTTAPAPQLLAAAALWSDRAIAPLLPQFNEFYVKMRNDPAPGQPSFVILKDEKDRETGEWVLDLQAFMSGRVNNTEFKVTARGGGLRDGPASWRIINYKDIRVKKRPPGPFDMPG